MMNSKAWAFTLDGHVFYVIPTGDRTLVLDLTTGQWHQWRTWNRTHWNAWRGIMWRGQALAADMESSQIWQVDPTSMLDEGEYPIIRIVSAFTPFRGRGSQPVGKVLLSASMGSPDVSGAVVQLRFSDDEGETWSRYFAVALQEDNFAQEVSFRSLGRVRAPGRVWELVDDGGLVTIEGLHANLPEEDE
jgi:hypothetical protein